MNRYALLLATLALPACAGGSGTASTTPAIPEPTGFPPLVEQAPRWWAEDYPVTQAFGCTSFSGEPYDASCPADKPYFHAGVDVGIPCGTPLVAAFPATVVSVGGSETYYGPYYPRLRLADGHDVILAHVQATHVAAGDEILPGDVVSDVGTLGNSTGCHLHFEVRPEGGGYGTAVDPAHWLLGNFCPMGNGVYCGGNGILGDSGTLYDCENGILSVVEVCPDGCTVNPPGQADACQ